MPQSPSESIEPRAASSLAEAFRKLRYVEAKAEGEGSAEACAEEVGARKALSQHTGPTDGKAQGDGSKTTGGGSLHRAQVVGEMVRF